MKDSQFFTLMTLFIVFVSSMALLFKYKGTKLCNEAVFICYPAISLTLLLMISIVLVVIGLYEYFELEREVIN